MPRTVIGIGSNLGDRLENLRASVRWLRRLAGGSLVGSPIYETEPVGPPQPRFLNAAVLFVDARPPREILKSLLSIERELGRIRTERYGPRLIDLDVLWIEGVICREPDLDVPHAALIERAFALRPLLDLVPGAVDPRTGKVFQMPATGDEGIVRTEMTLE